MLNYAVLYLLLRAVKGSRASQHLKEDAAEGPHVGFFVVGISAKELRRAVIEGAHGVVQEPVILRQILTYTKIRYFDFIVFATQKYVLGLQVGVDHLFSVDVVQRNAYLYEELRQSLLR